MFAKIKQRFKKWLFGFFKEDVKEALNIIAESNDTTAEQMIQKTNAIAIAKQKEGDGLIKTGDEKVKKADGIYSVELARITEERKASYEAAEKDRSTGKNLNQQAEKLFGTIKKLS